MDPELLTKLTELAVVVNDTERNSNDATKGVIVGYTMALAAALRAMREQGIPPPLALKIAGGACRIPGTPRSVTEASKLLVKELQTTASQKMAVA